jgi:hypothetical protein
MVGKGLLLAALPVFPEDGQTYLVQFLRKLEGDELPQRMPQNSAAKRNGFPCQSIRRRRPLVRFER